MDGDRLYLLGGQRAPEVLGVGAHLAPRDPHRHELLDLLIGGGLQELPGVEGRGYSTLAVETVTGRAVEPPDVPAGLGQ